MSSVLSATYFQSDMDRLPEKILETGMPLEIEYGGKRFLIHTAEEDEPITDFWKNRSPDEMLQTAPISPVSDISDLASDFWPEDESADDLIDYIYQQRKEEAHNNENRHHGNTR